MRKCALQLLNFLAVLVVLMSIAVVVAQEKQRPNGKELLTVSDKPVTLVPELSTFAFQGTPPLFGTSEFSFEKLVKGAPFSAEAVTEVKQTLSDGNRIVNTRKIAVYRDSQGRTRRERLKSPEESSAEGGPAERIMINDPATGDGYELDPVNRIAVKNEVFKVVLQIDVDNRSERENTRGRGPGQNFTFAVGEDSKYKVAAGSLGMQIGGGKEIVKLIPEGEGQTESLGTQTVEGVSAVGTRTTITIPAGKIGNERPIEIVDEAWYSPELQTTMMSRHSDPRSGQVVYRLTNISRAEPDHSLFEVPANYKIKEMTDVFETKPLHVRRERPEEPEP